MNMRAFVDALTLSELNEVSNLVFERRREYARTNIQELTQDEMNIAFSDYIGAIKLYRARVGVGLFEAKLAVDVYRGSYKGVFAK